MDETSGPVRLVADPTHPIDTKLRLRMTGSAQAGALPCDSALDRVAEVVEQVPPAGDLDRQRSAAGLSHASSESAELRGDDDDDDPNMKAVLLDTQPTPPPRRRDKRAIIPAAGGWHWLDPAVAFAIAVVVGYHALTLSLTLVVAIKAGPPQPG